MDWGLLALLILVPVVFFVVVIFVLMGTGKK